MLLIQQAFEKINCILIHCCCHSGELVLVSEINIISRVCKWCIVPVPVSEINNNFRGVAVVQGGGERI